MKDFGLISRIRGWFRYNWPGWSGWKILWRADTMLFLRYFKRDKNPFRTLSRRLKKAKKPKRAV